MYKKMSFAFTIGSIALTLQLADCLPRPALAIKCRSISEYYDSVTDSCEPCTGICDLAHIKRTERECETQCKDYILASKCPHDQYYDIVVYECAPCSELCNSFELKKTGDQCFSLCPDYNQEKLASSSTNLPDRNTSPGDVPVSRSDTGLTVAIVIVGFAVIAFVAILVMIATARCWASPNTTCCGRSDQGGYLPVQEKNSTPPVSMPIPCTSTGLKEHKMTASITRILPR